MTNLEHRLYSVMPEVGLRIAKALEKIAEAQVTKPPSDYATARSLLRDFVRYVSPGDDLPLAAMLDETRAFLAKPPSNGVTK